MAFYTPSPVHRHPDSMLPTELLIHSTSPPTKWNYQPPLTPPWTSTFERRKMTALPPISSLDRALGVNMNNMAPLTPPDDLPPPPTYSQSPQPPQQTRLPSMMSPPSAAEPPLFTDSMQPVDWVDFAKTRSAQFIAEKTCEMICYLWFNPASKTSSNNKGGGDGDDDSTSPILNRTGPATTLQLIATPAFVHFMQKLLETTQVSQSVIVLSLRYIHDLKKHHPNVVGAPGSEFRVAVGALMMANKFLDDNTYTNKTWSEVSGIDLKEINDMEREFLLGVGFNLYVSQDRYKAWLNLLKGLVIAKERDSRRLLKRTRTPVRQVRHLAVTHPQSVPHPSSSSAASRAYMSKYRHHHHQRYRARSTSPSDTARVPVLEIPQTTVVSTGSKRSAEAAFSPTSATFSSVHHPAKKPQPMALTIPETAMSVSKPSSYSPLEGLNGFAQMSLDSPNHGFGGNGGGKNYNGQQQQQQQQLPTPPVKRETTPGTLITGYALDDRKRSDVPQNLYFYTLSCSPLETNDSSTSDQLQQPYDNRKGRLRYHQPPPPSSYDYYTSSPCHYHQSSNNTTTTTAMTMTMTASTQPSFSLEKYHYTNPSTSYHHHHHQPEYIQSASTSPVQGVGVPPTLPHFRDTVWTPPPPLPAPAYQQPQQPPSGGVHQAPFANAGPPGVHLQFYPTPVMSSGCQWGTR